MEGCVDHQYKATGYAGIDDEEAATRNVTDLRRARQRARHVIQKIKKQLFTWLEKEGVEEYGRQDFPEARVNEAVTRLSETRLRNDLVDWLKRRRQITMARAVRAVYSRVNQVLGDVERPAKDYGAGERHLNKVIRNIDMGLLVRDDGSIANELAAAVTRQLRQGVARDEKLTTDRDDNLSLKKRVNMVLSIGTDEAPALRKEAGITGDTMETKAELISHDSVQQGYMEAATKRYLNNGFRYLEYDAVCDYITSDLCWRLGECSGDAVIIDLTKTPWLVPPNHPWCRSGVKPYLNKSDREGVSENDISDSYLQTIFSTAQYRPQVLDVEKELQPTRLQRGGELV